MLDASKTEKLEELKRFFDEIDSYNISFAERDRLKLKGNDYVYGDTPFEVFLDVLKTVQAGEEDVFMDLGSGCGRCVFTASLFVKKAVGIELLPKFVEFCNEAKQRLGIANAEFRVGNIREANVSEASIIYLVATTWTKPQMNEITKQLEHAKKGTRIITATKTLASNFLKKLQVKEYAFAWSNGGEPYTYTFYFYEKI